MESTTKIDAGRVFGGICYISVWLFLFYTIVDNNYIATPDVFVPLLIAGSFQTLPLVFLIFSGMPVSSGFFHSTGMLLILAAFTNIAAYASAVVAIIGIRNAWSSRQSFANTPSTEEVTNKGESSGLLRILVLVAYICFFSILVVAVGQWGDEVVDLGRKQLKEHVLTGSEASPVPLPKEARRLIKTDGWLIDEIDGNRYFLIELFNNSQWSVTSLDFRIEDTATGESRIFRASVYHPQIPEVKFARPNMPFKAIGNLGQFITDNNGTGGVVEVRGYK